MVLIPPGEFLMGSTDQEQARLLEEAKAANDQFAADRIPSEGPQHRVRISRPFYLGKYEVTQAQWEAVLGNNPSKFAGNPSQPVEQVGWDEIQSFLSKANASGKDQVMQLVLPTEAEWEYACRAGTTTSRRWYSKAVLRDMRLVCCQCGWQDPAGWPEEGQCLGPVRHARQRVGVVCGLVR